MSANAPVPPPARISSRGRAIVARVLVVIGVGLTVISLLGIFVKREALDTGHFRQTARELFADEEIRDQLAATMVETVYANVNVSAELRDQLPKNLKSLSGPIAGVSRALADRAARDVLAQPRTQRLFVASASTAQKQLIAVLEGNNKVVAATHNDVVLNIRPLVLELATRFNFISDLGARIPPGAAAVTILRSDELQRAQDATQALKVAANWIWVLAVGCWVAAIWLVPGRRRRQVWAIGIGLTAAGVLLLVIRALLGDYIVDHLVVTQSVRPAARNTWEIITDDLAASAWVVVWVGVVAAFGAWATGQTRRAVTWRRRLAPQLRRPEVAYGMFALLIVVVLWLVPVKEVTTDALLVVLSLIGFEILRRQAAREVPAAAHDLLDEFRERIDELRDSFGRPRASRTDELERLAKLHADGALTDEEFAAAKADLFS